MNEAPRAKARGFLKRNTERLLFIRTLSLDFASLALLGTPRGTPSEVEARDDSRDGERSRTKRCDPLAANV